MQTLNTIYQRKHLSNLALEIKKLIISVLLICLPLTGAVTAAVGGGMTIPFIAPENQNGSADSTTGSFKIGHYLNDDVLLYFATETWF